MREKRWVFAPPAREASGRLARALRISPLAATLLVNRGAADPEEARRFLKPELSSLRDPLRFDHMGRAVDRLERAVRAGEKVGIFGDYDVDGTAGTAILVKLLRLLGSSAVYRVPHRVKDGYGLNDRAIEAFTAEGVSVLVTVDCGTNDLEEIALARSRGMDVVVVDHHETPGAETGAIAVLNPKVRGSAYGFTGICSAGIAFKLAWAIADRVQAKRRPGFEDFILDAMGLVALGTVADVCPLVDENRILVRYGLDALRACRGPGIAALRRLARLEEDRPIDTFDIGFKLAPRLNALGRLGTALDCVDLLTGEDPARIEEILGILEKSNRKRKGIEDEIFQQACEQVESEGGGGNAIVVADPRWHVGVVGIVAARLVDRYYRPAFVLAVEDGVARGSARSIDGFPLHEALAACGELLETHGGHAMAAGLSLRPENLEAFRRKMLRHAATALDAERLRPKLDVDDEVPLEAVTRPVVRELERLAPHGPGNPVPVLVSSHVRVAGEPRLMGKKADHLSLYLTQGGASVRAVGFGMAELAGPLGRARTISAAYTPQINSWQGRESVELRLLDVKLDP